MVGEAAKKKLYDAATKGELATFEQLLQEDPYLVDEVSFACSRNLLHVATMQGQAGIVEEITRRNPQLARDLDSKKSSPLHIAAAQGNVEIAMKLLSIAPETCWWRDCHDMNPLHIAAVNGRVEILEMMLHLDSFPAMERVHRGQTVLHLCVKHRRLETLKVLMDKLGELVCAKDDDGETILHLAVRCDQLETIRYLIESKKIKKHTPNSMGKTALDILNESPPHPIHDYSEIRTILMSLSDKSLAQGLPKMSDMIMMVVLVIATVAFQAAISPPGGVWQDNTSSHRAGEAVLAYTHPKIYKHLVRANATAFVSSLITILLIITGLPSVHFIFMSIALYAMWVALTSIAITFGVSITVFAPYTHIQPLYIIVTVIIWFVSIFGLILLWFSVRRLYLLRKSEQRRRQEDPTIDSLILRILLLDFPTVARFESQSLIQNHFPTKIRFSITGRCLISYSKLLIIEYEFVM